MEQIKVLIKIEDMYLQNAIELPNDFTKDDLEKVIEKLIYGNAKEDPNYTYIEWIANLLMNNGEWNTGGLDESSERIAIVSAIKFQDEIFISCKEF